jgi:hypothetical protein
MSTTQVLPALRKLLLPSRRGMDAHLAIILGRELRSCGVNREDFSTWIESHLETWEETGSPSKSLSGIVKSIVSGADLNIGSTLAISYFSIHGALIEKHAFTHQQSRAFLSAAFLMYDLATRERMSAAQISRVLSGRGENIPFSRQSVLVLLNKLKVAPKLSVSDAQTLFEYDKRNEIAYFADADVDAASIVVSEAALSLGASNDITDDLRKLAPENQLEVYSPYLQILHYQCLISEHFDHALLDMYEFNPRGQATLWLVGQYPAALVQAENPFLNNAKSVESLDEKWIRSKKEGERPGARALYHVLCTLDQLSFEPRRELAKIVRAWLHRVMSLSLPLTVHVPSKLIPVEIKKLVSEVSKGNTRTFGIIEQRVVDTYSVHLHPSTKGWRSRGIGDSVNTTNVSQSKLGDCDYQMVSDRRIVAYEAHGGKLTDIYVDEHLRTMRSTLNKRSQEMIGIADINEWTIELVFVSHEVVAKPRPATTVSGVNVKVSYQTFEKFINSADHEVLDWTTHLLEPINRRGTPIFVKNRLNDLLK